MLDTAYEQRKQYVIELAKRYPRWGLGKIARETNKVYGSGPTRISHRGVKSILDEAGFRKVGGEWVRNQ